ncbi:SDR family NAD(P)-dependent oxidoreductase [Pseudonocardia acaciae]|uniref:SDR family NAD(P)-dependent oxidoreductase n=1 Tax=Pseudonocardia acaciae TaxID=551276 RepID=UPI00048B4C00|nr:SDR family oxidoreductase [Pseudonocardia acaciae]
MRESAFDLSGRVAVVVGGGSEGEGVGIGRACAVLLARYGASVAVLDLRAQAAEQTLALVRAEGADGHAVGVDVADQDALGAAIRDCAERLGGLDVLVNNVGIVGPTGTAEDLDPVAWELALRVNVTAMMTTVKHAVPLMRARGGGSIVNMGSVSGLGGGYPHLSYATTKGAVNNLTRAMAGQHGPDGIRVNAVAPGQLYTPRIAARAPSAEMRRYRREVAPLRTEGDAWDAAHAVLFLASPAARWITGVVLPVDAGLSAVLPLSSPPPSDTSRRSP